MFVNNNPSGFKSVYKINGVPILAPVITDELREEIRKIREIVRAKEEKLQKRKADKEIENQNLLNLSSPKDTSSGRRLSYTLTSPIFEQNLLPNIEILGQQSQDESQSSEENTETIVPATTVNEDQPPSDILISSSDESAEMTFKSSKDLTNEIDRKMLNCSIYESEVEQDVNNQLKDLIEKQKSEYIDAMETLKSKFSTEQEKLLSQIETNLLVTSTPMTNMSMITTDDEDFVEFKTCLGQSNEHLIEIEEKTMIDEFEESEKRQHAATVINSHVRGYLTRRLMHTIYVQEHVRNITETLQLVLSLDDRRLHGSPVQSILLKAKLFRQLSTDLKNFSEIFFDTSVKEQMKIIASDREVKKKKEVEDNLEQLNLSFHNVV